MLAKAEDRNWIRGTRRLTLLDDPTLILDAATLGSVLRKRIEKLADAVAANVADVRQIEQLQKAVALARSLPFAVDLCWVQTRYPGPWLLPTTLTFKEIIFVFQSWLETRKKQLPFELSVRYGQKRVDLHDWRICSIRSLWYRWCGKLRNNTFPEKQAVG